MSHLIVTRQCHCHIILKNINKSYRIVSHGIASFHSQNTILNRRLLSIKRHFNHPFFNEIIFSSKPLSSLCSSSFMNEKLNNFHHNHVPSLKMHLKALNINELSINVTPTEMTRFLTNNRLKISDGHNCIIINCPFCSSKCDNKIDNSIPKSLFINKINCTFICYSCELSGSWTTLVELLSMLKSDKKSLQLPHVNHNLFPSEEMIKEINNIYKSALSFDTFNDELFNQIINKFKLNGLTRDTLIDFGVKLSSDHRQLIYPFDSWIKNRIIGIKFVELNAQNVNNNTFIEKLIPTDIPLAVFGLRRLTSEDQELVIAQTPQDAMAITQSTNIPSVTFPSYNGTIHLRPEILPVFEQFKKMIIWFGNSSQEWDLSKTFARKLNEKRCHLVCASQSDPLPETPLAALQNKRVKLIKYLQRAQPVTHESITTFKSLRHALLAELKDPQCSGVLWHRYPELNKHLKGHRSGELTVFTGPTGCGKTTFMSEYSLDLCMSGVRTLWGSFEVKNVRLAKMMMAQYAEKSLITKIEEFDHWADRFEQLPLYFLTFHGQESVKNVLSAMSHAVYVHDIKHVIIDNIQFMLGCDSSQYKFDRFWQQDLVLDSFRKFATREDCHVTLVIHPRKEVDMDELNNNSIFGGAKASQEADNILILQNKWLNIFKCHKYVEITKNRWDGDLGKVPLWFDKDSLSYSPKSRRNNEFNLKVNNDFESKQMGDVKHFGDDHTSHTFKVTDQRHGIQLDRNCVQTDQEFDDNFRLQ